MKIVIKQISFSDLKNFDLSVITQLRLHLDNNEKILKSLKILSDNHYKFFLAFNQNQIVGFISAVKSYNLYLQDFILVDDLIVNEKIRGQKIGSKLLQSVEEYAKKHNIYCIKLDSGTQRLQAHNFYENHNFHKKCYTFEKNLNTSKFKTKN